MGNHLEANEELDFISARKRSHPDVLELRWNIYAKERKWDACADIGLAIMKAAPARPFGWIHRSFALHRLKRTEEAFSNLAHVGQKFYENWTVQYNLACYCSVLHRFDESKSWFKRAMLLDEKKTQRVGIDDPDLLPLWDSMSGTIWSKDATIGEINSGGGTRGA